MALSRKIQLKNATPDMTIAKPVFHINGTILLPEGIVLDEQIIKKLERWNIIDLYIIDTPEKIESKSKSKFNANIDLNRPGINPVLRELSEEKVEAIEETEKVMNSILKHQKVEKDILYKIARKFYFQAQHNIDTLLKITTFKSPPESYIFSHAVNTTILSIILAIDLKFREDEVIDLALGTLLHDTGMLYIPKEIVYKNSKLTEDEFFEITKHPIFGINRLEDEGIISRYAARIAYQHHERLDGSGYPRGRESTSIQKPARLVAITDVFDGMTSPRTYRKAFFPSDAMVYLKENSGSKFDRNIFNVFFDRLGYFPPGTIVKLNTNEIGIVSSSNYKIHDKPKVKLFINSEYEAVKTPSIFNLAEYKDVFIERSISLQESGLDSDYLFY